MLATALDFPINQLAEPTSNLTNMRPDLLGILRRLEWIWSSETQAGQRRPGTGDHASRSNANIRPPLSTLRPGNRSRFSD